MDRFVLDVVVGAAAAGVVISLFLLGTRFYPRRPRNRGTEPGHRYSGDTLTDPATGLVSRQAWNEVMRREQERLLRYGRPVTVMVAELDGLDSFAASLGQEVADYLIPPVAAAMRRNGRAGDVLARSGYSRFVGLMPETDEVAATNYVERVRSECDRWLEACSVSIRLAIGWAQPLNGEHLADALRLAEDRMNIDRRRYDFHAPPSAGMPVMGTERPASSAPVRERP